MRLLHTSDWHLGRRLHGVPLHSAHEMFLDHLVDTVRTEHIDVVLVAGDVYDRAVPAPETVSLLDDALVRIVDAGAAVVLSTGNHDSPARLGFGGRLLAKAGVHVAADCSNCGTPIEFDGVSVYPLPYLEPHGAADGLTSDPTQAAVLRAAMDRVRADAAGRATATVVMAHAFVSGGVSSESERDITAGGVGVAPVEVFEGADVVALGHLHGAQQLGERVRYSGSPVAMSFGEAGHRKGTVIWTVEGPGRVASEFLAAPVHRGMSVLRGELADLLADPALRPVESAYCQVILTDPVRPAEAMTRLRTRFPHTLRLDFEPSVVDLSGPQTYAARVRAQDDLGVCSGFLTHVRGGRGPDARETAVLSQALVRSAADRLAADDEGRRMVRADETGAA